MKKLSQNLSSLIVIIFFFLISACSSIPKNTADGCSIFSERYLWYKHAKKAEKKWGTPIYIQLAFIKMESDFDWLAKPKRLKIFKVIHYRRPSSSLGYSQAVEGTWKQYKEETNNKLVFNFHTAYDFDKRNKIKNTQNIVKATEYLARPSITKKYFDVISSLYG